MLHRSIRALILIHETRGSFESDPEPYQPLAAVFDS